MALHADAAAAIAPLTAEHLGILTLAWARHPPFLAARHAHAALLSARVDATLSEDDVAAIYRRILEQAPQLLGLTANRTAAVPSSHYICLPQVSHCIECHNEELVPGVLQQAKVLTYADGIAPILWRKDS